MVEHLDRVGSGLVQSDGAVALNNTLNPGGFNALVNSGTLSSNNAGTSAAATPPRGRRATLNVTGAASTTTAPSRLTAPSMAGLLQYTGSVLALNGSLMVNTRTCWAAVLPEMATSAATTVQCHTVNNSAWLWMWRTAKRRSQFLTLESYNQTNDPLASIEFDIAGPVPTTNCSS